jgi:hypothetical protein
MANHIAAELAGISLDAMQTIFPQDVPKIERAKQISRWRVPMDELMEFTADHETFEKFISSNLKGKSD